MAACAGRFGGVGRRRFGLAYVVLLSAMTASAMAIYVGLGSNVGNSSVADRFVAAANRGDYETVCHLYSPTYLKVSQTECRRLYRWGERLYGRYEYRITARRRLPNGHWRVSLTHWLDRSPSFIEIAGGKIVAGGW